MFGNKESAHLESQLKRAVTQFDNYKKLTDLQIANYKKLVRALEDDNSLKDEQIRVLSLTADSQKAIIKELERRQ